MKLSDFKQGLEILSCYMDTPDGFHLGADHDIIYFYATDKPVDDDDFAKLKELGWFQPDANEEDEDGETKYSPTDGWAAYV